MFDMNIEELVANFNFLDDWEDRYRYLLDLSKKLPEMPDEYKTEENKVNGCTSQVWIKTVIKKDVNGDKIMDFIADSDAHIVKGLIAVVMIIFVGKTLKEISLLDTDSLFAALGLDSHLSPSRRNGLASMVQRIKSDALNGL